jgi:1-deoxy-D-xylulose-5-phosphate reductoisomerase
VIVLGSTGSIGVNTLAVVDHLRSQRLASLTVVGLAAGTRCEQLAAQAHSTSAIAAASVAPPPSDTGGVGQWFSGEHAAVDLIDAVAKEGDLVIVAIVGAAGMAPVLAAIERGCDIALANKESLVMAGDLVMSAAAKRGVKIIPIDSEHSGIFQCLGGSMATTGVRKVTLTCSGGSLRDLDTSKMHSATVEMALAHPTWSMGPKVTIDSATVMNKTLEMIEAHHLFGLDADALDAVIHRQSIVHSFVEFDDGSVLAQLAPPDMRLPIQYALTHPHRLLGSTPTLDLAMLDDLTFEPIDPVRFPAITLADHVITTGQGSGAVLNGANEIAVEAFLSGEVKFPGIVEIVAGAVDAVSTTPARDLEDIMEADAAGRRWAQDAVKMASKEVSGRA